MDESFVDLGAASLLRQTPSGELKASSLGSHPQSFEDMFNVLTRTFDLASSATQVLNDPQSAYVLFTMLFRWFYEASRFARLEKRHAR